MKSDELWRLGAATVASGIRKKTFSARDVVTSCVQRYEATHSAINALTEVRAEDALMAADEADRAVQAHEALGPLHGVPVTIKDNVDLEGWATVNGCAALRNNIARATSPCVQNWLNAGAIVLGRTNTPEFCCRWETNNDVFGPTRNPWDRARTPGGSSGGAAASLAAGVTPLAQGNDLGGSLRQPAQACGIASLRPGIGRVPVWNPTQPGEPGMGVQMMHVEGPMARRIEDVRLGLRAMVARDRHDPWWVPAPLELADATTVTAALVIDPAGGGVSKQVASGVERAGKLLEDAGYKVDKIEPPGIGEAAHIWRVVCLGELQMGLEPAVKDICGPALRRTFDCYRAALPRFDLGMYASAFARRVGLLRDWLGFFERYGVIVAPVGTEPPLETDGDIASPERMAAVIHSFRMTIAVNALGLPAAVVPVGVRDGLPQVVQIIGPPFSEMRCLAVAEAIERQVEPLTPIDPRQ